ncbi:mechanosensitive ion channel [bacterium]|nr:mechanosensitive ion channel [bacterium]
MAKLIHSSQKPLTLIFFALLAKSALVINAGDAEWRDSMSHVSSLLAIACTGWLAVSLISVCKAHFIQRYNMLTADNYRARRMHTQFNVLYRVIIVLIIIITLALMLMTFDSVTKLGTSLLASAGVTGILIGFAAQKTIGSIFAGIQIAITQPINIEDAVVIEGEWGWIEEITLTYVVVRIWDLRRLVVPITYFNEKPFQNWTRRTAEIIGTVEIYADYTVPVDEMREELTRLLEASPLWNKRTNVLQVTETTEKAIKLRALVSAKDSPTTWDLRCYVREGLMSWLQRHYPHALPQNRVVGDEAVKLPDFQR